MALALSNTVQEHFCHQIKNETKMIYKATFNFLHLIHNQFFLFLLFIIIIIISIITLISCRSRSYSTSSSIIIIIIISGSSINKISDINLYFLVLNMLPVVYYINIPHNCFLRYHNRNKIIQLFHIVVAMRIF